MSRKIITFLKDGILRLIAEIGESAERSARIQEEIESARSRFYRRHADAFIRRGIL
jgi:hypothetical protein